LQQWESEPGHAQHAEKVDLHVLRTLGRCARVCERVAAEEAGIVDEEIKASEPVLQPLDRLARLALGGHVEPAHSERRNLRFGACEPIRVAACDDDPVVLGEPAR
jgi:hypothetical protein